MGYSARILLDSVNPVGDRLTTFELCYPRFVHAELLTHRTFSRNAASSRAIPVEKMIARVREDPVFPVFWGKNQKGMQADEELEGWDLAHAQQSWLLARDDALTRATDLLRLGLHKQIVNRLLEPWAWITVICSATEFGNWFTLRCDRDAQPEIKYLADLMRSVYERHKPVLLQPGEWHLPLVGFEGDEDLALEEQRKVSVGRCARVSYLTHDGRRDAARDIELHDRLLNGSGGVGHLSPFEHAAQAMGESRPSGNFTGWLQYRKVVEGDKNEDLH